MPDMKKLNKKQILKMIQQLKKNPGNKNDIFANAGIFAAGAIGLGSVAAIAGTTTASIPVITALTGFGVVVAAPVGLVAGAAVAGGAAAYGVSKWIKGNGFNEGKKRELLRQYEDLLRDLEAKEKASSVGENEKISFHIFLEEPLKLDLISAEDAQELILSVENGQISLHDAYNCIGAIISEAKTPDHSDEKLLPGT